MEKMYTQAEIISIPLFFIYQAVVMLQQSGTMFKTPKAQMKEKPISSFLSRSAGGGWAEPLVSLNN